VNRVTAVLESNLDGPLTSDKVFDILLSRHREYQRKSQKELRNAISAILIQSRQNNASSANAGGATSDSEDDIQDTEDKSNMLNSRLYKESRKRPRESQGGPSPTPVKRVSSNKSSSAVIDTTGGNGVKVSRPTVRFCDMGGIESCLQDIRELCQYPLSHPEIYDHLGIEPPRGILLHGPPGCGKTMLARAIAGEMGCAFFSISAPEIVSGMSGESEEKLRKLFESAKANAPSIIFLDEIDAITGKRESTSRGMERRIVAQLLTCMDSLRSSGSNEDDASDNSMDTCNESVLVIGATNRPDALDPALRRAGRFDREIPMGIPDSDARARILECISSSMRLSGDFDFHEIARLTPGFVGADLNAVAKEAAVIAVNRVFSELIPESSNASALEQRTMASEHLKQHDGRFTKEQLEPVYVKMPDFLEAVSKVQPSAKREGFATVPSVTWDDIGSLSSVRFILLLFELCCAVKIVFYITSERIMSDIYYLPTHSEHKTHKNTLDFSLEDTNL